MAAQGGVMGIATVNFFVSNKPRSTLDDYVDHIEHVVNLVGIDHVGIVLRVLQLSERTFVSEGVESEHRPR